MGSRVNGDHLPGAQPDAVGAEVDIWKLEGIDRREGAEAVQAIASGYLDFVRFYELAAGSR